MRSADFFPTFCELIWGEGVYRNVFKHIISQWLICQLIKTAKNMQCTQLGWESVAFWELWLFCWWVSAEIHGFLWISAGADSVSSHVLRKPHRVPKSWSCVFKVCRITHIWAVLWTEAAVCDWKETSHIRCVKHERSPSSQSYWINTLNTSRMKGDYNVVFKWLTHTL